MPAEEEEKLVASVGQRMGTSIEEHCILTVQYINFFGMRELRAGEALVLGCRPRSTSKTGEDPIKKLGKVVSRPLYSMEKLTAYM